MSSKNIHKAGSLFSYKFEVFNSDGLPNELPASEFKSTVNTSNGTFIADLVIVDTEIPHVKKMTYPDTSDWKVGLARLDIMFPIGGEITKTFEFTIEKSETKRT